MFSCAREWVAGRRVSLASRAFQVEFADVPNAMQGKSGIVGVAVAFEGGLAGLAWVLGWWLSSPPLERISVAWDALVWAIAGTAPLVALLWWWRRSARKPFQDLDHLLDETVVPLFARCSWLDLALISLAAGFGEEMLFRGVIQPVLSDWSAPWMGLTATSILFGLAHIITPSYAFLATVIGAYLGWLAVASENLLVPIAVHALYDFAALIVLVKPHRDGSLDQPQGKLPSPRADQ